MEDNNENIDEGDDDAGDDSSALLGIEYDEIRNGNFENVNRLERPFTNRIMIKLMDELRAHLSKDQFFSFIKCIVDESTALILDLVSLRQFEGKLTRFIAKKDKQQKNPAKFVEFCNGIFEFSVSSKRTTSVDINQPLPPESP